MSERSDEQTRSFRTTTFSALPAATASQGLATHVAGLPAPGPTPEEEARARIGALEREARALGNEPQAALLFHEMGLLWEEPLRNPRNAAVAFQAAYRLAPRFVANVRAARRLFADVGNWVMVLQLLDAELAACEEPRGKAGLLLEKALILEERLSREPEALTAYRQCLELAPHDVGVLTHLEGVYAARGDFAALVQVYRLMAATLEEPALRAHALTSAGLLLEDRLKQPEQAAAAFREAFALDRTDLLLLSAIKRLAEREGRIEELVAALQAEADVLGPQAVPAYLQLAKVHERQGRSVEALGALLSARRVSPNEPLVLSELASIYEREGRHEDLADVLHAWVGSISDESELVAINLRLAALYEEDLKRDAAAVAPYRAILARIPGHQAALAGLGKLSHRMGDWEGLLAVYDAEIAASEDPRTKAARVFKAAEILEERLSRQEEAIARYNQCLQLQPGYLPAQKALTRLYEREGRYGELVAMYEQDLLQTSDRDQLIATLHKIAVLHEERLGEVAPAIECMRRVLELAPDHLATLRNLARLLEKAGRWQELLETHELEASHSNDTKQVLSLHHRNAEILDEHLKDRAGATHAYERLLALSPSYLPALKALGRLYAQEGRWEGLIRMYRAEAEIAATTEQAASLIQKIGELYEQRLTDENQAIASYQEVLTLAPSYFPALRALARIYRRQGAWESLVEVLRSEAANRTDPVERANALFQAAAIWEDRLGRADMAVQGYQEVLRLTPGHAPALRALERLYTAADDVRELIAVLDRETQTGQTPATKVAAWMRLARLYLDRLNEPARAAQCCEAALGLEPGNFLALKTLERIRAADRARRSEVRLRLAERVGDARLRHALRLSATGEAGRISPEATLAEQKSAFALDPEDGRLAFVLERALRLAGDTESLRELWAQRLERTRDAQERLALLLRIADLSETKLGDLKQAKESYEEALQLSPQLLPALQGMQRVALALGDVGAARAACEAEARAARDHRGAIEAWVGAAALARRQDDAEGAVSLYRKALELDPLDAAASTGLEALLAQRGGAADLAALQERRGEARLVQKDAAAAAEAFFSAARTYLELSDRARALNLVERTLAAQPTHTEALELKARLCLEEGAWAEACSALQQRVQQGGEPDALARLHLTLGTLFQDRLGEPGRAAAHLQTVLTLAPRSVEALERLAGLHRAAGNWTGAADCLKRLLELTEEPSEQARHLVSLAGVVEEGFADMPQAAALYRRALELNPGDAELVDRLVVLYERTQNVGELVQVLEAQAASSTDVTRAVALRLKVGELYTRVLGLGQKAITVYRQVLEMAPDCIPAHAALAELYGRDTSANALAIESHRQLLKLDPTRVESLHALFRTWSGSRQLDKAYAAASLLAFLRANDDEELAFLAEARSRPLTEPSAPLSLTDVDATLMHPAARGPLLDVLRAIGDQLSRLFPPALEGAGIDRRADRLKADHAVHKAIRAVTQVFGVEEFDVYQSRRGLVFLETTEPLGVCVGQDVVRKFNAREQKFLIGRTVLGLLNRAAVLSKLSVNETADLLGNTVRIHVPDFNALGRRNDEQTRGLKRAANRKALKALEEPSHSLREVEPIQMEPLLTALQASADRAGLLMCGDPQVAMMMVLRDDPAFSATRVEGREHFEQALRQRADLQALMAFALSEDHFRLRTRLGVSL